MRAWIDRFGPAIISTKAFQNTHRFFLPPLQPDTQTTYRGERGQVRDPSAFSTTTTIARTRRRMRLVASLSLALLVGLAGAFAPAPAALSGALTMASSGECVCVHVYVCMCDGRVAITDFCSPPLSLVEPTAHGRARGAVAMAAQPPAEAEIFAKNIMSTYGRYPITMVK